MHIAKSVMPSGLCLASLTKKNRQWSNTSLAQSTTKNMLSISKNYKGFRPSARWVDCWACWTLSARQRISIVSERKRNDLYVCFKRNNFTSSAPMLSNKSACVSNVSPTSTISKLFFESPSQIAHL